MWYKSENGNATKPNATDSTSSQKYVYVRKNFVKIDEDTEKQIAEHWEWMEKKVLKEDWDTYQQIITNTSDISDVNDALVELADIIGG